jgi:hypothetical protein
VNCERCNGPCWDNRERIASGWKGPLYKCKDRNCGWVQWPPRASRVGAAPARSNGTTSGYSWGELHRTYARCHQIAGRVVGDKSPDLQAATATIFIAATKMGLKVEGVRTTPPPPPPPPPEDDYANEGEYIDDGAPY